MGELRSGKPFYYRVAESLYHTLLIRSEAAVFHEITNGPFRPGDTEFAPWAPAESDAEGIEHHVSETTLKAFAEFLNARR